MPEYLTLTHPPLFPTTNATLLALAWGIAGTWWIGAAFGFVLASITESRETVSVPLATVALRVFLLIAVVGACALAAGLLGYKLATHEMVQLPLRVRDTIPVGAQKSFAAVWAAHITSYLVAFVGGALLIVGLWREHGCPNVIALYPSGTVGALRAIALGACVAALRRWPTS